jgi:hypothetical protein
MTQYRNCTGFSTETVSTWIQKLYRSTKKARSWIQKLYRYSASPYTETVFLIRYTKYYTHIGIKKKIFQHEIQRAVP